MEDVNQNRDQLYPSEENKDSSMNYIFSPGEELMSIASRQYVENIHEEPHGEPDFSASFSLRYRPPPADERIESSFGFSSEENKRAPAGSPDEEQRNEDECSGLYSEHGQFPYPSPRHSPRQTPEQNLMGNNPEVFLPATALPDHNMLFVSDSYLPIIVDRYWTASQNQNNNIETYESQSNPKPRSNAVPKTKSIRKAKEEKKKGPKRSQKEPRITFPGKAKTKLPTDLIHKLEFPQEERAQLPKTIQDNFRISGNPAAMGKDGKCPDLGLCNKDPGRHSICGDPLLNATCKPNSPTPCDPKFFPQRALEFSDGPPTISQSTIASIPAHVIPHNEANSIPEQGTEVKKRKEKNSPSFPGPSKNLPKKLLEELNKIVDKEKPELSEVTKKFLKEKNKQADLIKTLMDEDFCVAQTLVSIALELKRKFKAAPNTHRQKIKSLDSVESYYNYLYGPPKAPV